jgi:hypothetical protein
MSLANRSKEREPSKKIRGLIRSSAFLTTLQRPNSCGLFGAYYDCWLIFSFAIGRKESH